MDLLRLVLQCLWLMLPGIAANMAPVLGKGILPQLAIPVDGGAKWKGKRILGDHKTVRGFILGILAAVLITLIQQALYSHPGIRGISIIDYQNISAPLFGFVLGSAVLLGDSIKSFFKRRAGIEPGEKFIPWDQTDAAISAGLVVGPIYGIAWSIILLIIILSFIVHVITRLLGYALGITKTPWA